LKISDLVLLNCSSEEVPVPVIRVRGSGLFLVGEMSKWVSAGEIQ
jgi:hypothetical protein